MRQMLLVAFLAFPGCTRATQEYSVKDPISVTGGAIQVEPNSKFMEQITVVPVSPAPGGERAQVM